MSFSDGYLEFVNSMVSNIFSEVFGCLVPSPNFVLLGVGVCAVLEICGKSAISKKHGLEKSSSSTMHMTEQCTRGH